MAKKRKHGPPPAPHLGFCEIEKKGTCTCWRFTEASTLIPHTPRDPDYEFVPHPRDTQEFRDIVNQGNRKGKGNNSHRRRMIKIAERQKGWRCHYCGNALTPIFDNTKPVSIKDPNRPTLDHVKPVSKGGSNKLHNLVLACAPCNEAKADTWEEEGE